MPNTSVRAAAEGMPAINRRRLLLGLAAASTAAAAVTVAPEARSGQISENPELLRLGNEFPAVANEYRSALAALNAIVNKWSKVWPVAPDEIIAARQFDGAGNTMERDITGHGLCHATGRPRYIYSCENLDWELKRAKSILKGKTIDKRALGGLPNRAAWEDELDVLVAQYTAAAKYEAEKARVLAASGHDAADRRKAAAAQALIGAIDAIMAQPETTMAGVVIKAQALAAWSAVEKWQRILTPQAVGWGSTLSASVLRLAGEA
ncbi:hypothetical protein [Mesorhizobium wenxiniae]|uniref:Uncharacterized protein n=1 Tax=Mesorhizobium wenxiniae TaxID=2014805 RepID=A0A271KFS8_9HYPH|nr:hypothetical protein [Mesorhizobium wenxiniae]PAP94540.1 hypothetical protein CIT31_16205 [Mesorhizobium wenxiniae]